MKKSLIIALALMLVLAFATSAMAAQITYQPTLEEQSPGNAIYDAATGKYVYGFSIGTTKKTSYSGTRKKFNADGVSNYPYEIYLPNETSPASYRIHSNYAKATDACASCHSTHTAVGNALLQWFTAYDTCMACHDGTIGTTYDVAQGKIGAFPSYNAPGGAFGLNQYQNFALNDPSYANTKGVNGSAYGYMKDFQSSHNVTGAVEIAAAPGGSMIAEATPGAHGATNYRWTAEFGCESCHSPHGQGGNARILHPDANYAATWAAGQLSTPYKYFLNTTDGTVYSDPVSKTPVYIIKGYPYSPAVILGDVSSRVYKIDNSLGYSRVLVGASPATNASVYVTGVAAIQVKMNITGYLTATESVKHKSGMNYFCGTCHTDYNTATYKNAKGQTSGSAATDTGTYSKAHRHQMGMGWYSPTAGLKFEDPAAADDGTIGTMECLTCHVAHGVNNDFWARTLSPIAATATADGTLWSNNPYSNEYQELAGSSALKRMPNMGVCEACHTKGDGNQGYDVNTTGSKVTPVSGVINGDMFDQRKATFSGSYGSVPCAKCHKEAVAKFLETQHAFMLSPLEPGKQFTVFNEETGEGNVSQKAYDALRIFKTACSTANVVAALTAADGATHNVDDAIIAAAADENNIISAGQLPIGFKTKAVREIAIRTESVSDSSYRYTVVGALDYANGSWGPVVIEKDADGHVHIAATASKGLGSCATCHMSLIQAANATAALDAYTLYWDGTNKSVKAGTPELGIQCEACHGEASNHIAAPSADNIYNPNSDILANQDRVCGRCHVSSANKGNLASSFGYSPWKLASKAPVPAGTVTDVYDSAVSYTYASVGTQLQAIFKANYEYWTPELAALYPTSNPLYANGPLLLENTVTNWSYLSKTGQRWDGAHHNEYVSFAVNGGSHFEKRMSCTTCHDSHADEIAGQLQLQPGQLCGSCHGTEMIIDEVMPRNPYAAMHDFNKLIDDTTKNWRNTALSGATDPAVVLPIYK